MTKKLMVTFVAAFVVLTVAIAVLNGRKETQKRTPPPATPTNNTLSLDTAAPKFPER
jgi:preprotein translocase subunit SecG